MVAQSSLKHTHSSLQALGTCHADIVALFNIDHMPLPLTPLCVNENIILYINLRLTKPHESVLTVQPCPSLLEHRNGIEAALRTAAVSTSLPSKKSSVRIGWNKYHRASALTTRDRKKFKFKLTTLCHIPILPFVYFAVAHTNDILLSPWLDIKYACDCCTYYR